MYMFRVAVMVLICFGASMAGAQVATLPDLSGAVILTVTGLDRRDFPEGEVQFDLARLDALGGAEITTSSIWTRGRHVYSGVTLHKLAQLLHFEERQIRMSALNAYAIEMPAQDATEAGPILAVRRDGAVMTVRDKGPIWVIFPYDDGAAFRTDTNFARSIWQLDRIEVLR